MKFAVTGAFGYSGRYIAGRLLEAGHQVITLTNSAGRENPFGGRIQAFPFNFDHPARLRESLKGMDVLINTYWVRFNSKHFTHSEAVHNTRILFQAAKQAGVKRIVHISITNPDLNSDLPYFRGKAQLEMALHGTGVSYCVLRPTVLFGKEDILINNIAWSLRHLPVIGIFGAGDYKLQPIYVDDLAAAVVDRATHGKNEIVNAIGPETLSYRELVHTIQSILGLRRVILNVPPDFGYLSCRMLGLILRDMIITRHEIQGLMQNRLCVDGPALGNTCLTEWIARNRHTLGKHYTSELSRRLDRHTAYQSN